MEGSQVKQKKEVFHEYGKLQGKIDRVGEPKYGEGKRKGEMMDREELAGRGKTC